MSDRWAHQLEARCLCSSATFIRELSANQHYAFDAGSTATLGDQFFFGTSIAVTSEDLLWVTNGTYHGTFEVGTCDFGTPIFSGKSVVFYQSTATGTDEVWRSDGTIKGTYALTNFPAGTGGVEIFGALGNTVVFDYIDDAGAGKVYAVDADQPYTYRLLSLGAGLPVGVDGSKLFFDGGRTRAGLYCTDGRSSASTILISTVEAPAGGSDLSAASIVYKHDLFFAAYSANDSLELWKSDGTHSGTVPVEAVTSDSSAGSEPEGFTIFDGMLYFISAGHHDDLNETAGAGAKQVTHYRAGQPGYVDDTVGISYQLTAFDGSLYRFDPFDDFSVPVVRFNADGVTTNVFKSLLSYDQTAVNGSLFFQGVPADASAQPSNYLYQSNGTDSSLVVPQYATLLGVFDHVLYFGIETATDGVALYDVG